MTSDKLDELLSIVDRQQRKVALIKYAESLGINYAKMQNKSGGYNEEKLAILIFDAQRRRKKLRLVNYRFYIVNLLIATLTFTLIVFLPKLFRHVFQEENEDLRPSKPPVVQGFDKEGKPLVENGQPVLFKMMDGEYQEFDDAGRLKYEFFYDQGTLLQKKEFGPNGEVVAVKDYPHKPK
jgi:hypothetical protein